MDKLKNYKGWIVQLIRLTYKDVQLPNDIVEKIGHDFIEHLKNKLTDEQLDKILPKDGLEVIMNMDHPLKQNGFHPALVLHLLDFVEEMKAEVEQEVN